MPSPFPGMNPYLEQSDAWTDFHDNFIIRIQEVLSSQVGPNYLVKLEVQLILHERSAEERRFFGIADVAVAEPVARERPGATVLLPAPIQLELPAVEIEKHRSIEVRDRKNRRLVTVIELLSPANKTPGTDRDDYLNKRKKIFAGTTHLVEIDLRRGGARPEPPKLPICDYCVLVSRAEDRPHVGFWPIALRDPLPDIPVPLNAPDPPVILNLKAVLDKTYDAAGYEKYIYQGQPEPALSEEDMAWANEMIAKMNLLPN